MTAARVMTLGLLLLLGACGKATPPESNVCVALKHVVPASAKHLATCSDSACGNGENPPTGGDHCSTVLACRTYTASQPRCQWLHNTEHGHVVLLYNCPDGCADTVAELEAVRDEAKQGSNGVARVIIAPDSTIPSKVSAVAWGWSWSGDEDITTGVRCILAKQDAEAPEPGLGCAP